MHWVYFSTQTNDDHFGVGDVVAFSLKILIDLCEVFLTGLELVLAMPSFTMRSICVINSVSFARLFYQVMISMFPLQCSAVIRPV